MAPTTILWDNLPMLKREDEPEKEVFVTADIVEKIIRYYIQGPDGDH